MSKSVGGVVLGVAGAVVGAYLGGPSGALQGASLGFAVGSAIDPATIELRSATQGYRLDPASLVVQSSAYGLNIPRVSGKARLGGNIIWGRDIKEVKVVRNVETTQGGKGGGTTVSTNEQTTYAYFGTFAVALCKGPVVDVLKIWADTKLIYNIDTTDTATLASSALLPVTKFLGTNTQAPSSVIESFDGAGNVPAYRDLCYLLFNDLPLADFGNRIPSLTFEISS